MAIYDNAAECVCGWNQETSMRLSIWCPRHDPPQQPVEALTRDLAAARLKKVFDWPDAYIDTLLAALFPSTDGRRS